MAKKVIPHAQLDAFSSHVRLAYGALAHEVCLTFRPESCSLLVLDDESRIVEPLATAAMSELLDLIDEALAHFGPGLFQLSTSPLPQPTAAPSLQLPW